MIFLLSLLCFLFVCLCRLNDVIHSEGRLYLVFEFVDMDLKKYMESIHGSLDPELIRVSSSILSIQTLSYCVSHSIISVISPIPINCCLD